MCLIETYELQIIGLFIRKVKGFYAYCKTNQNSIQSLVMIHYRLYKAFQVYVNHLRIYEKRNKRRDQIN